MKILITSDNHLGYKEDDPLRMNDSYDTFEEVLQLGTHYNVDLIIQVGDLFHDNRPSRYCINRTIKIIKKYILKNTSSECIPSECIPFVCIHGNHDEPSGINNISAVDILQSAGLVKYIGKFKELYDQSKEVIEVYPMIYGNVRIYGVGHIKDRKLCEMLRNRRIRFMNLEYQNSDTVFNILLLHQNRVPRNKDYIPIDILPRQFDLVIYGHEHDPLIIKEKFTILQTGSTVRTSLCEGENTSKYTYILEDSDLYKIELKSVRPFYFDSMKAEEEYEVINKINDIINKNDIIKREDIINENDKDNIIDENTSYKKYKAGDYIRIHTLENPLSFPDLLPLVRIRVETRNMQNINKNRISHMFKDRVCNSSDIIKYINKKKNTVDIQSTSTHSSLKLSDILVDYLRINPLECIPEYKFIEWVNSNTPFMEVIEDNMEEIRKSIIYEDCILNDIMDDIRKIKEAKLKKNKTVNDEFINNSNSDNNGDINKDSSTLIEISSAINEDKFSSIITDSTLNETKDTTSIMRNSTYISKDSKNLRKMLNNNTSMINTSGREMSSGLLEASTSKQSEKDTTNDISSSEDILIDF